MGFAKHKKMLLIHLAALMFLLLMIRFYKCPFSYFFHIDCPGCGITRACIAALRLDFKAAWEYHPLFFTVIPTILYAAHRDVLPKRLNTKAETILYFLILISFMIVYIAKCFKQ